MSVSDLNSRTKKLEEDMLKHQEVINNHGGLLQRLASTNDQFNLKISQLNQIIEQYRVNIYNMELRFNLIVKILEEKGIILQGEFDKRWPVFLKNDIGVPGSDGLMEGSLKVSFYGI